LYEVVQCRDAITAIKQALALDKKAENARELGLDYEPVAWMYPDDYKRMLTSETFCTVYSVEVGSATRGESTVALYTTPPAKPAVPEGWKLVPAVPTNEWVNNLAKMQTGDLEEVPFVEIHQCIAELLAAAPEKGQP
jgi:hypothetical protein